MGRESCAAFNAACLAGESPALVDCLFDQVVMSGLGGGDESHGSISLTMTLSDVEWVKEAQM